jgi:hypothetical protein
MRSRVDAGKDEIRPLAEARVGGSGRIHAWTPTGTCATLDSLGTEKIKPKNVVRESWQVV